MCDISDLSSASARSIQSWIETLPASYEVSPHETTRKRKAQTPLQPSSGCKRKRTPLGAMSGNAKSIPLLPNTPTTSVSSAVGNGQKRLPSRSPENVLKQPPKLQNKKRHKTADTRNVEPAKCSRSSVRTDGQHLLLSTEPTFATVGAEEGDVEDDAGIDTCQDDGDIDVEETPRARRKHAERISDWASQASTLSESSSRQSAQSRAPSPAKMADLRPLDIRLKHLPAAIEISDTHELAPLRDLLQVVDNYTQSCAFLPGSARSELQACRELDRDSFYDSSTHRQSLGKVLSLDDMLEIHHCTINGKTMSTSEPEWNTTVHHLLLRMALKTSVHHRRLGIHTITTSKISPSCLPTTKLTGDPPISGRHVDFAISIKSDDTPLEAVYNRIPREGKSIRRTFNQTDDPSVAETPFAISIETKPFNTVRLEDGRCQISLWALAQFRKAELLQAERRKNGKQVEYMVLPMLHVSGPDWRLFVAVKNWETGKANLYEGSTIASTDNKPGVYRIHALVQLVMDWAERVYRPWFERIMTD